MPMIDVYAPKDLLPAGSDRKIGEALTMAVLRAEGVTAPGRAYLENTAAFIHRMEPAALQTAAQPLARAVRVQIITPSGALSRASQKQLVKDATAIIADACSDRRKLNVRGFSLQRQRGGWGMAGTAFGREEFAALAAAAKK